MKKIGSKKLITRVQFGLSNFNDLWWQRASSDVVYLHLGLAVQLRAVRVRGLSSVHMDFMGQFPF